MREVRNGLANVCQCLALYASSVMPLGVVQQRALDLFSVKSEGRERNYIRIKCVVRGSYAAAATESCREEIFSFKLGLRPCTSLNCPLKPVTI